MQVSRLSFYPKTNLIHSKFTRAFCSHSDDSLRLRLQAIEKQRLSDPKEELARLKSNPSIKTRLENVLSLYEPGYTQVSNHRPGQVYGLFPSIMHQISYCRSIELLKTVGDTHFVLNHGQSSCLLSLNILNCELQNIGGSNQLLAFETKLRHPLNFVEKSIRHQTESVDWFKKTLCINDHEPVLTDHCYTNYLIACDGYLGSTATGESALCFFITDLKVDSEHKLKWQAIDLIARNFISDLRKRKSFLSKFMQVDKEIVSYYDYSLNGTSDSCRRAGNLYSILIPKKNFDTVGYLATSFGFSPKLNQPAKILLNELQDDETAGKDSLQVRLVAEKINSINDVKIFVFPTRPDYVLKEDIKKIRALVKEYF